VLSVYRRHKVKCAQADDRVSRKCRCPLWATGALEGEPYRKSLKTRNWERAEQLIRQIEEGTKPSDIKPIPELAEAIQKFMLDAEHGRKLTHATLKKYRVVLAQLKSFADTRRVRRLADLTVDFTRMFRGSWKDGSISSAKKLERLRAFFRFCVLSGWMTSNPAQSVSQPVIKTPPTLPYSEAEMAAMLKHATDPRWHALIQILRWS
jgi:hypothetical protein